MAQVISASSPLASGRSALLNVGKAVVRQLSNSVIGSEVKNIAHDVGHDVPVVSRVANSAMSVLNNPGYIFGSSSSGSGGGAGGGSAGSAGSSSGFIVKNGKVQFADPSMQYAMQMINQQAAANNQWSAEQAQKQMDFQKMMSDTAHQREVADLQAAGLNPVLSAGGQGASVSSGAMAQTDDSNTRLLAELAIGALDAVQTTAVGVAGATSSKNNSLLNNYFVKRALGAGAQAAGSAIGRSLINAIF